MQVTHNVSLLEHAMRAQESGHPLFSATMTDDVEALINQYFNQPVKVEAAPAGSPLANINQTAFEVPNFNTKVNLLRLLLYNDTEMKKVLVFLMLQ